MNLIAVLLLFFLVPKQEFHQGVDYAIEARLDDTTNVLTGRAELRYTNRSPDLLDTLYFHLHLNAFRPNSAWARRELQFNIRRFQDLAADDHAFDRVSRVTVNGTAMTPVFPFAPDSTVMAVPLPARLAPTRSAVVRLDWTSRLATIPRRQGRSGRHYDWAHWYPRIAVYDSAGWQHNKLVPQGEFFGEFASYDVTLDVAADHVIGATGVPVSGDPGWQSANRDPANPPVLKRTAYGVRAAPALGLLSKLGEGRKRVRWRAEQVHHFAWATDPSFVYEGSTHGDIALHNLFLPDDTMWRDAMAAVKSALAFFDTVLGPYAYPQLTTARRLDGGGTEFPMITMNGASPPIVHEVGHQWAHAILANNEFRAGWLDEGFDNFLGKLYEEANGRTPRNGREVAAVALLDSAGISQPIATHSADFRDFNVYSAMVYSKSPVVFRMLRWLLGDAQFRAGLKLYYQNNKLQHVDEEDFRRAMEQAGKQDLRWFFQQWLHTTATLDYSVTNVTAQQTSGAWRTTVQISRAGDIWMPVDLKVGDTKVRLDSRAREFSAVIETSAKPDAAVLDPDFVLIDIARGNNRAPIN